MDALVRIATHFKFIMVRGLRARRYYFSAFPESRHNNLTRQLPACYDSGAFSETTESALFCPAPKMLKAPSAEGAFFFWVFTKLHGKVHKRF